MWFDEENTVLGELPFLVVGQIRKGIKPCELTGLSVDTLDYIRAYQLSKQDILTLAGLSIEQARDLLHRRDRNGRKTKERR